MIELSIMDHTVAEEAAVVEGSVVEEEGDHDDESIPSPRHGQHLDATSGLQFPRSEQEQQDSPYRPISVGLEGSNDDSGSDDVSEDDDSTSSSDNELLCPICLETSPLHSMVAGHCQHSFCVPCLSQMLITKHKKEQQRNRRHRRHRRRRHHQLEQIEIEAYQDEPQTESDTNSNVQTDDDHRTWTKSLEDGGLCPLCRASLPLKELKYTHDGSCLTDSDSFQKELNVLKEHYINNDPFDEEEGTALVSSTIRRRSQRRIAISAVLSFIYGDDGDGGDRGRRMDRLALTFCVLFMFGITLIAIVVQVRLAGNFHNDYYNEAEFYPADQDYFEEDMKGGGRCSPPMPTDCRDNGLYQCPPKTAKWFSGKNVGHDATAFDVVILNQSHSDIYQDYPVQIASCSTTLPLVSAEQELFTFQKYAWATVVGTGGWIHVERYSSIPPCNGTELDVYLVDDAHECHSSSSALSQSHVHHEGFAQKSCSFDPNCLAFNPDLWSVEWLSQEGQVYAIFDEQRRGIDAGSTYEVVEEKSNLRFTMLADRPTHQLCHNAMYLEPGSADVSSYEIHGPMLLHDAKPIPKSICGGLEDSTDTNIPNIRLWFQTRAPLEPGITSNSSSHVTVSLCSDYYWYVDETYASLVIVEGTDCNQVMKLMSGDPRCIASLNIESGVPTASTANDQPVDDGDSPGCYNLTWGASPYKIYTVYFEGSLPSDWVGTISVSP